MQAATAIGARIMRARAMCGFHKDELAARTGLLTPAAIEAFEAGRRMPDSRELLALALALGVRCEYFFRPKEAWVSAPRLVTGPACLPPGLADAWIGGACDRLERQALAMALLPAAVPQALQLPAFAGTAEQLALAVRKLAGLNAGPPDHVADLVERFGIWIVPVPVAADIDAAALEFGMGEAAGGHRAVLFNPDVPRSVQRLAMVRELGYFAGLPPAAPELAVAFARALLLPRGYVVDRLGSARIRLDQGELELLAGQADVPFEAVRARCVELYGAGAVDGLTARPSRPSTDGVEAPSRLEYLVLRGLAEGELTPGKAAELLGVERRALDAPFAGSAGMD